MKIDDKDIDKLLEDFQSEKIIVPEYLDDKLNKKLIQLKSENNKSNKFNKVVVAVIITLVISYSMIPSFRSFAGDVFKYIFGDIGIENAINNGYTSSDKQNISIGDYNIDIENIYIDNLRISFDAIIKNPGFNFKDGLNEDESQHSIYIDSDELNTKYKTSGFSIDNGLFNNYDGEYKANIQLLGDGVNDILKNDINKLTMKLNLVEHKSDKDGIKDVVLGSKYISISIPKGIGNTRKIDINKTIDDGKLKFNIESLEISPTMMYLNTNGEIENIGTAFGLYNFRLISDKNKVYGDNLTLSGRGDKYSYKQTIVPSMYYDNSKSINIVADGVMIMPNYSEIEISLNDNYPKKIHYFGTEIYIEKVEYTEDNKLRVYISDNDKVSHAGTSLLDGEYDCSGGMIEIEDGRKTYLFDFEADKKDSYIFSLQLVMKYEIPIDVKVDVNN